MIYGIVLHITNNDRIFLRDDGIYHIWPTMGSPNVLSRILILFSKIMEFFVFLLRYNTTDEVFEGFSGTTGAWSSLGSGLAAFASYKSVSQSIPHLQHTVVNFATFVYSKYSPPISYITGSNNFTVTKECLVTISHMLSVVTANGTNMFVMIYNNSTLLASNGNITHEFENTEMHSSISCTVRVLANTSLRVQVFAWDQQSTSPVFTIQPDKSTINFAFHNIF